LFPSWKRLSRQPSPSNASKKCSIFTTSAMMRVAVNILEILT
jgi:hypothetical protein